ncbi:MAG: hypothetical protein WKF35_03285 [Ferruginibacter sp.]
MTQSINHNEENSAKPGEEQTGEGTDRKPGQGNSNDGLTRRLGDDLKERGIKEKEKNGSSNIKEEDRTREGSQGGSKGQGH